MMRRREDRLFRKFQQTRDPALLGRVFDRTVGELWRVAAHLSAGDRDRAEDALQATYLTALEHPGQWDAERPLVPWLLGVLANHVRKERRNARRLAAEASTARAGTAPDAAQAAADREWSAEAERAIVGLPQPYREVLVLHLQHGLDSKEIGRALGRQPGTVRTQIARGLVQLRRVLPAGFAAGLAIAALAADARAALRYRLVGDTGMRDVSSVTVATVAVASAVLIAVLVLGPALLAPAVAPPVDGTAQAVLETAPDRDAAELPRSAAPRPASKGQDPRPRRDSVRVRVALADGEPAGGVIVGCHRGDEERFLTTDARGRVAFSDLPEPCIATFWVPGTHATALLFEDGTRAASRDLELRVAAGLDLDVTVRDAAGFPVEDAAVEANFGAQPGRTFAPVGRTNADGRLRLRSFAEAGQLRASAPGLLPVVQDASGRAGETLAVTLTLGGPAATTTVTVVAADGAPLPHARVAVTPIDGDAVPLPFFATAGADGTAQFASLAEGRYAVTGRTVRGGQPLVGLTTFSHPGGAAMPVELRLGPGATVHGTCLDEHGEPAGAIAVRAEHRPDDLAELPLLARSVRSDLHGRYVLDGLMPGRNELRAFLSPVVQREVELLARDEIPWDPLAPATVTLNVRLVDGAGRPLAGWQVVRRQPNGFPIGAWLVTDGAGVPGGADALWRVPDGSPHALQLHAPRDVPDDADAGDRFDAFPTWVVPPVVAGGEVHAISVPDHARPTREVAGRIVREDGTAPGRVRVRVTRDRAPGAVRSTWADPATGAFALPQLSPGRYVLTAGAARREFEVLHNGVPHHGRLDLGAIVLR